MISEDILTEEYGGIRHAADDVFFFQDEMQSYTYNYWLKPSPVADLLVVSENEINDHFALDIIRSLPTDCAEDGLYTYKISTEVKEFTHIIVAPSNYHSYLKGVDGVKRDRLYLCVPIYRCEFSGNETPDEFREMRLHYIPTLNWNREPHPKVRVYFDNPETDGGTSETGAILKLTTLLEEVERLNGVSKGFIEITNWSNEVIEIVSPEHDKYLLIRNREGGVPMSKADVLQEIKLFAET